MKRQTKRRIKKEKHALPIPWMPSRFPKRTKTVEKEINQYITLKLENGRTFIYVNGKRFIQCIRLILNIPKDDVPMYDEIESIDILIFIRSFNFPYFHVFAFIIGIHCNSTYFYQILL